MPAFRDWIPGLLIGAVGAALMPVALKHGRPVIKTIIKTGILVTDSVMESLAEAGEQFSDLVAEARAELAEGATAEAAGSAYTDKTSEPPM